MTKLYGVGDSIKSIPLDQLVSWGQLGNMPWATGQPGDRGAQELVATVAYLHRAVEVRAASLAVVPWSIYRGAGEESLWSSDDVQPPANLAGFADMPELLYRIEGSMSVVSMAYLQKLRNRIRTLGVEWLDPGTMTPYWGPEGLTHFQRSSTYENRRMDIDEVVYLWRKGESEIYPKQSPAHAALAAANALNALDAFVASFFSRGAIKATLLTVKDTPLPAEAEKLKSWWRRALSGIRNAFTEEVISAEVTPVVIGEGVHELSNTDLSNEKREDIATAMGVPHSLLMSDAANMATAESDRKNFYEMTIIPEAGIIERQLNAQLFVPMGLRFAFRPQAMSIFQEDESKRATAFSSYVSAGVLPSIAAQMLGIELPEGYEYTDLDAKPTPAPVVVQTQAPQAEPDPAGAINNSVSATEADDEEREEEVRRFRRWAKKRHDPDVTEFRSAILTDEEKEALLGETTPLPFSLPETYTPDSVKAMTLQLDPDDDEAEQKIRMGLEGKHARTLRQAFLEMYETLYPGATTFEDEAQSLARIEQWIRSSGTVKDALERMLIESADLGVSVAVNQLEGVGYGFDWTLSNTQARDWAREYAGTLVQGIDNTNLAALREATARWTENGEPLQALVNDLAPLFGKKRAEMIAATEVTRAYQQANEIAWAESGVVESMEWVTVVDERVCPVCGALHGEVTPLGQSFRGRYSPPAHPRCRCFSRPVLKEITRAPVA